MFLRFIRKVLTWDPEVRATSNELILDDWLMRPVDDEVFSMYNSLNTNSLADLFGVTLDQQ